MIVIVPVTLYAVVRRYPQLAMKCHYLLAVTGLASMSCHVWTRRSKSLWCLVAAAALWMFLSLASLAVPLRRRWGHTWPSVVISQHDELLRMDIAVPSAWKVEPGQYVYLWLPQTGLRTASQLPLFYVSSWEDTPGPNNARASTAEQGVEWRQVATAAERDAAVPTVSQRHGSRGKTSWNTAMGHERYGCWPARSLRHWRRRSIMRSISTILHTARSCWDRTGDRRIWPPSGSCY
jgi:hypothetical protein